MNAGQAPPSFAGEVTVSSPGWFAHRKQEAVFARSIVRSIWLHSLRRCGGARRWLLASRGTTRAMPTQVGAATDRLAAS